MNVVTLSTQAAMASVPSKVFKIMASGRPVLAITVQGNEVHRLVSEAKCGLCVPPDDPVALAEILRYAAAHQDELEQMGKNGRRYLEERFSRQKCVSQIEEILVKEAQK
jgi:glycosyltransferase involved in cell wall biosynthesis